MSKLTINTKLKRKLEAFEQMILNRSMEGVYRNALINSLTGLKGDMKGAKNEEDLNKFKNTIDEHFEDFVKNMVPENRDRDFYKIRYYNS